MPEYGYRDKERQAPRERSSSGSRGRKRPRQEKKVKKEKKKKRPRTEDGTPRPSSTGGAGASAPPADVPAQDPSAQRSAGGWRAEMEAGKAEAGDDSGSESGAPGLIKQETDEDVQRLMMESRKRREALIEKWVTRGEEVNPYTNDSTYQTLPTNISDTAEKGEDGSASDGELPPAQEEVSEQALEEKKLLNRFIMESRKKEELNMFGEEGENEDAIRSKDEAAVGLRMNGASGDDWDDGEGYYKASIGELMDNRYFVKEDKCGQGVFSNVIKAEDSHDKNKPLVAIKIMRCNDMMRKAAEKEVEILQRINNADRGNKKNVIRLLRTFNYRKHLCLVFECMWDNLRAAVKKYTKDRGMSLRAVHSYAKQLLVALAHIHRCQYIHADIKPDNILISAGHNMVKICDLGSAVELNEVEATPYVVSRFYRAPEIVLGIKYGQPSDTWALGASFCELFTGKILFPGKSNNDMLRLHMEYKGKLPHKMIQKGLTWKQHFNEDLDFKFVDFDKGTRKKKMRVITDCSAKKSILEAVMQRVGPEKQKSSKPEDTLYVKKAKQFADLINQMTTFDPERRPSPADLLQHPFVAESWEERRGGNKGGGGGSKGR